MVSLCPCPDGHAYVSSEVRVGELCHMRARLYHAMKHFKSTHLTTPHRHRRCHCHCHPPLLRVCVCARLRRMHLLLRLRSLLSQCRACVGAVALNVELIGSMFAFDDAETLGARWATPTSPSSLTAAFVRHQQSVHERLSSMAAKYAAPDTRRVRIDVEELDALYDIDEEACATHLFDLRTPINSHSTHAGVQTATVDPTKASRTSRRDERKEDSQQRDDAKLCGTSDPNDSSSLGEVNEREKALAVVDEVLTPRRLLLTALAQRATDAELRLLHSLLSPSMQRAWRDIAHR